MVKGWIVRVIMMDKGRVGIARAVEVPARSDGSVQRLERSSTPRGEIFAERQIVASDGHTRCVEVVGKCPTAVLAVAAFGTYSHHIVCSGKQTAKDENRIGYAADNLIGRGVACVEDIDRSIGNGEACGHLVEVEPIERHRRVERMVSHDALRSVAAVVRQARDIELETAVVVVVTTEDKSQRTLGRDVGRHNRITRIRSQESAVGTDAIVHLDIQYPVVVGLQAHGALNGCQRVGR